MIAKKNPKANLEKKRFAFFQIGLLVAGSLCLLAFEYSTAKVEHKRVAALEQEKPDFILDEKLPEFYEPPKKQKTQTTVTNFDSLIIVDKLSKEGDPSPVFKDEKVVFSDDGEGDYYEGEYKLVPEVDSTIHLGVDIEPSFPGGERAMQVFIRDNINLPNEIYEQGTIYVQFVVNRDGSIEQVNVPRGLSSDLNRSATDVVKRMPKWTAGEQMGKKVRVRFTLPIKISTGY